MSIVFMGTPDFALLSLIRLIESGTKISAVVTQPDRPQGRGNLLVPSPVKAYALDNNLPIMQPEKASTIADDLKRLKPDFIVVVAYGQILKAEVLSIPKKGCINVHASLLPLYRGASPIHCAIINGDWETGVTTMLMDKGMDTGPILLQNAIPIEPEDTAETLHDKLAVVGAELLLKTLAEFDTIVPRPQNDCGPSSCAPILCKGHGAIDWSRTAVEIHNLVRGCSCWPSAFCRHEGRRIIIWKSKPLASSAPDGAAPGTVIAMSAEDGIEVATGEGTLGIMELQREGKKRQGFLEFLRGYPLNEGDVLAGGAGS